MARARLILLALFIAAFAALKLFLAVADSLPRDELPLRFVVTVLIGISYGEFVLLALWLALAPESFFSRTTWAICLTVLSWNLFLIRTRWLGDEIRAVKFHAREALRGGLIDLTYLLVAATILGLVRLIFNTRLAYVDSSTNAPTLSHSQVSLRQILTGIGLLCVVLALGRVTMPAGEWSVGDTIYEGLFHSGTSALVKLAIASPCIWYALAGQPRWRYTLTVGLVYVVCAAWLELRVREAWFESFINPWRYFSLILARDLGLCGSVFGCLLLLRAAGLILVREPRPNSSESDELPPPPAADMPPLGPTFNTVS